MSDRLEAKRWLRMAAEQGNLTAKKALQMANPVRQIGGIAIAISILVLFFLVPLWRVGISRAQEMNIRNQNALAGTQTPEKERLFVIAIKQRNLVRGMLFGLLCALALLIQIVFVLKSMHDASETPHVNTAIFRSPPPRENVDTSFAFHAGEG